MVAPIKTSAPPGRLPGAAPATPISSNPASRKAVEEIGSVEAAKILGVSRASLSNLLVHRRAQQIIKWRWTTERQGKRLFETWSLLEYLQATREPEFGSHGAPSLAAAKGPSRRLKARRRR